MTTRAQAAEGGSAARTPRAQAAGGGSAARTPPNPHRGEASLVIAGQAHLLRPSFTALIATEEELGPLFALVERAGEGRLKLAEMTALFWHCLAEPGELTREQLGKAIAGQGLAACAKPLRALLGAILQGSE